MYARRHPPVAVQRRHRNHRHETGTSGFSGYSGVKGDTGNTGSGGASGFSGYSGVQGAGTSGFSGYSGVAGAGGSAAVKLVGQVYASVTKTNVGSAFVDIYVTAFDHENLNKIDFTGATSVRVIFLWDYVGAGTQQVRWVDAADGTTVLVESATFTADQDPGDTGWVALPAGFVNATKQIEMQGKSTTAADDPVCRGYAIYVK